MLFDLIAPVYGLFFNRQKSRFLQVAGERLQTLGLEPSARVIDIGCGTGALCSALAELGYDPTGIDPAVKMLNIARRKTAGQPVNFVKADILAGLEYPDKSFDLAIASYVAHGLTPESRYRMYAEMSRLSRKWVIIYDYNQKRSFLTSLIEWLEHGDYFRFIKVARDEMKQCKRDLNCCFKSVDVIDVDKRAAWYICEVNQDDTHS